MTRVAPLVVVGLATVVGLEVARQAAARRLARRTGRGFWRCYFSGAWRSEPLRGVPALAWWLGVAAAGMLAFRAPHRLRSLS